MENSGKSSRPSLRSTSAFRIDEGIVAQCPHCKEVNGFEDLDELFMFVCNECDEPVLDLSPILRQMVKTHFSLNGELSHGVVT